MSEKQNQSLVPDDVVMNKIYMIRDKKVMIDSDLAELYQVETKRLNEQVKRNPERFPDDFMFQLTKEEWDKLKSQNATSRSWGGRRIPPYAFTEHGVLMLSSILNSQRAIQVNIQIMRVYTKIRSMLITHKDLLIKMRELEAKVGNHDKSIKQVFAYLQQFIQEQNKTKEQIGFKQKGSEPDQS